MTCKKWLRPVWIAAIITAILAIYVGLFKHSPRGFFPALSDTMFLWGLTLLCISLVYVTRFFGFLPILKLWARFRPFQPRADEDRSLPPVDEEAVDPAREQAKRDPSLLYASLILIALSIPVYYL
ncbi:hypothetical protein [Effusibacillus pohliae]|uniref:hypothetical protein n=1 Tax=Effusibacillus pohliae TaxID=232270 RepID=UPI00036AE86D|nr:hypothetical protein [Effusibacillus pohliae]